MNTLRNKTVLAIATAGLLSLSACKSNQTQQQSSSMPGAPSSTSSSSPSSSSSSSPGSSSPSSSGRSGPTVSPTVSLPGVPTVGLPGPSGLPGPGFPSAGMPGSSLPGSPGEPGQGSSSTSGSESGSQRGGSPGEDGPAADANGDGIPDTAQSGQSPYDDVDFSESSGGGGGSAASREEQVATLDQELEGSMRDYDGKILEERAGVMGRANTAGSEEQLDEFDRSVAYYDEAELDQASGEEDISMDETPPPAGETGEPSGVPTRGGGKDVFSPPEDIPSGDDDDVVARQIREAAMKERDPDLREALWEEYRKYKNQ